MPRIVRPASPARNPMAVNNITTVVAKGSQGMVANSTRLASATKSNDVWMRAMILSPSASTSMSVSAMGDPDLTLMRSYFVKPADRGGDELLRRSAAGPRLRPVHRTRGREACDPVVRDAHRVAAVSYTVIVREP